MFAQRLAGHSVARIARALNDAGIPCPSAADPKRNPHRSGTAWTLATVVSILANPRYTGRQVWNRQRTDSDLVDPADTGLGHRPVQRWNLRAGWVISARPAHPAIVSEADYIAAQEASAPRGPVGPATRRYLLAGLLRCGRCGRRLESAWSNGKPAYRAATAVPAPPVLAQGALGRPRPRPPVDSLQRLYRAHPHHQRGLHVRDALRALAGRGRRGHRRPGIGRGHRLIDGSALAIRASFRYLREAR